MGTEFYPSWLTDMTSPQRKKLHSVFLKLKCNNHEASPRTYLLIFTIIAKEQFNTLPIMHAPCGKIGGQPKLGPLGLLVGVFS